MTPSHYINRELSWLEFNSRVLEEAADRTLPLLERLKFIAIFSNNLDEFFMVRVAGLRRQHEAGGGSTDPAGLSAAEQLQAIRAKVIALQRRQYALLSQEIFPGLEKQGLRLVRMEAVTPEERLVLQRYFTAEILPVLTPIAVDPSHPFPFLASGILEIGISLRRPGVPGAAQAFVEVPKVLSRFVALPQRDRQQDRAFVFLEDLIMANLEMLFPQCRILSAVPFRICRDMDFSVDEEGVADLLDHMQKELRRRRRREPIRLEVPAGTGASRLIRWLKEKLELEADSVYSFSGPLNLADFFGFLERSQRPDLLEPEWRSLDSPLLPKGEPIFAAIRKAGAIPLFPPFEAFAPVIRLLEAAADDPEVLAIKQTLYRVSGNSPVVQALQRAAENGKQVTVIVEIRARFDEERNIQWARSLEESGAHVVYGIVGLKIHAKALLIVRREEGRIRRYLHLGTGNYNDRTARIYTDIGMFLTDDDICMDVAGLFNVMTGYSQSTTWRKVAVAPFNLRQTFLDLIDREIRLTAPHQPGEIIAKINSLVDPEIIEYLIKAAAAGVKVSLIVRGICCLRPQGDNIRVISVVDRYLEHSRIFYFGNGGHPEYYLSSADWMQRNLDRRIELLFPVEDAGTRKLLDQVLEIGLSDRRKGRWLQPDGSYSKCYNRFNATRSQRVIYDLFRTRLAAAVRKTAGEETLLQPIRYSDKEA